jgi:hypothetical protein
MYLINLDLTRPSGPSLQPPTLSKQTPTLNHSESPVMHFLLPSFPSAKDRPSPEDQTKERAITIASFKYV